MTNTIIDFHRDLGTLILERDKAVARAEDYALRLVLLFFREFHFPGDSKANVQRAAAANALDFSFCTGHPPTCICIGMSENDLVQYDPDDFSAFLKKCAELFPLPVNNL